MRAPKSAPKYEIAIKNFNGIDLRNAPSKVAFNRSPMCPNMIRETVGNNRKRRGYETVLTLKKSGAPEKINGFHDFTKGSTKDTLIHAGTSLYKLQGNQVTLLYGYAKDDFSTSKQVSGTLYIFDGKEILKYDGASIKKASEGAYIPTIFIAKRANGGGVTLEPINLLTPFRKEKFTGDSDNKTFQLSTSNLDSNAVKIQSMKSDGSFEILTENTHFTVNRTLGTFTLNEPKPTPITGEDNLIVTYAKTVSGYSDRVNKCKLSVLYGTNGLRDRVFISGNPDYKNYDWYCKSDDPTMWGDTWYSIIGQDNSSIVGYSIINDRLITHKDGEENDINANVRIGTFDEKAIFKTVGNYPAVGALSSHSFCMVKNEPLYIGRDNTVSAITHADITGEKISSERSRFISFELKKEDLKNSFAIEHQGFYVFTAGDRLYILDSLQISLERGMPYSDRQYECYMFTDIGARILHEIDGRLYFGTEDGKIKRFFNDDKTSSFYDDGKSKEVTIEIDGSPSTYKETYPCYWETAELYGTKEELKKTFRHLALCLNTYPHTSCRIWAKVDGNWEVFFDYNTNASYFDFEDIDFDDFSFRGDNTPTLIGGKFKVKKVLHLQLRFENSRPQPFSILWAKLKYVLGGNYVK